jgi:hypothetical protein
MALSMGAATEEPAADRRDDHAAVEARMTVRLILESAKVGGAPASVEVARAVDEAVAAVLPAVKRCLAFVKAAGQSLPDALVVALTIDAAGRVTAARIENAPAGLDASLRESVQRAFLRVRVAGVPAELEARIRIAVK